MRQYYTIVHPIEDASNLTQHLAQQGIEFKLGAELESELKGFHSIDTIGSDPLWIRYIVLIDEYELSALKLTYDDIRIVHNRPAINLHNRIRGYFKWFLK